MTGRRYMVVIASTAAILLALTVVGAWQLATRIEPKAYVVMLAAAGPFAAVALFSIHYEGRQDAATLRRATVLILGAALLMRLILLPWGPDSSDVYRYVWDGRVQAAGINPYRYIPADPALAKLRDQAVYPNINRADYAPTIYPPTAQMVFALVGVGRGGVVTMKFMMVLFEMATVRALLALLARRGLPSTRVLLYAWHPLPLFEFAGSGHVDSIAIAFMLLAFVAVDRGHAVRAGALLAAAFAAKFFPLAVAPALYRRWGWRLPVATILVAVALYLPYLSVGRQVFGFLGGYRHEEGLDDGTGFFLLNYLDEQIDLPAWSKWAYLAVGTAMLAAGAGWALWRRDMRLAGVKPALFILAVFTLVASPHLAWYFTWTIPFLCLVPWWSVMYLTCAAALLYGQVHAPDDQTYTVAIYGPFLLVLIVEIAIRRFMSFRRSHRHLLTPNHDGNTLEPKSRQTS